jgi:signal transduction histidine kinase
LALVAMPVAVVLGAWLAFVLLKQILEPIKRLAAGGDPHGPAFSPPAGDEIKALSHRVHSLIEDVGETKTKLELSQEHLLQSEKWAMVGKLAAGVAHSIRNPLTSVKMRLFSMERTLELTPTQKEDIEVISDEIRHLDNIVRNFLEFSRPPKLKMQEVSPSDVVDMALQLLQHRLESYEVNVTLQRGERLPSVWGDPEQLKEVMVNLLVNACEAMPEGGDIVIRETAGPTPAGDGWVSIRVTDEGPGVPRSIQDMVFQPFFTTKEEGTGLGLSIAARIVEEHEGQLTLESDRGKGACFIVSLPVQEA